jgi:hypothetical protein
MKLKEWQALSPDVHAISKRTTLLPGSGGGSFGVGILSPYYSERGGGDDEDEDLDPRAVAKKLNKAAFQ